MVVATFSSTGYSLMFLNGAWVKATPAFNRELCTLRCLADPSTAVATRYSMVSPLTAPAHGVSARPGTYDDLP
jgi:hypothetical protein